MTVKFPRQAALVACRCRACSYGCTGCGSCAAVCQWGAITMGSDGAAQVAEKDCVACGACIQACPQGLIHLHDCGNAVVVKCANRDKGAQAPKQCGCIGCGRCERACPTGAIRVQDNCAVIDEALCLSCGMCAVQCPRHVIEDLRKIFTAP